MVLIQSAGAGEIAAMNALKPKRRPAPGSGRSRVLRIASLVTIGLTAILVVVFVVQIASFDALKPPRPQPRSTLPPANQITANRSTIAGYDKEQQPFVVNARLAKQDAEKNNIVHLTTIDGKLNRKDGAVMTVSARNGTYDTDSRVLDLEGDVRLASEGKFVANMEKARVFLEQKRLVSHVPVTVSLQNGKIAANGMEITDNGNHVVFLNRVQATYAPQAGKGDRQ